jgi:hypothetical protein
VPNATGNAWDVAMAVGMAVIQGEAVKGRNHVLEVEFASVLKEVN